MEKTKFQELKELIKAIIETTEAGIALRDGYQMEDSQEIMEALASIPDGISGGKSAIEAFKSMPMEQQKELVHFIKDEFDLPMALESTERFVEETINVADVMISYTRTYFIKNAEVQE